MHITTKPEHDALSAAVEAAIDAEHDAAERRKRGERSSEMFHLCYLLRSDERFTDWDERQAFDKVTEVLRMHHPHARDVWESEFPECDDPQMYFRTNWNVVMFPAGLLERAVAYANVKPIRAKDSISPKYDRFLSLCAASQHLHGDRPFPLSVERFAEALGVDRRTITEYKRRAIEHNCVLRIVEAPIAKQRAARARFIVNETVTSAESEVGRKACHKLPMKVLEGA